MDERNQQYYYEDPEAQSGTSETPTTEHESIDIKPIADAIASASNGPNGADVCKTIRHGVYVAGGLIGLKTILDFICRMKCVA